MDSSGLARIIADGITSAFRSAGSTGTLLGVVLATVLLTELVTNNAAALLMLPVGIAVAEASAVDPRGMAAAVAVAASASFLTPIGYQTNTMVYGPGGYRVSDYLKMGAPLTVIVVVGVTLLIPLIYPA
jgi:di/tricarboxylate transporter